MHQTHLLVDLISRRVDAHGLGVALVSRQGVMTYGELYAAVLQFASGMVHSGLMRGDRVAIFLDKCFESVIASFGATAAGGVFVPVNPVLKVQQVVHILRDCNVRVLVTSPERLESLQGALMGCPDLHHVVVTDVSFNTFQVDRPPYAFDGLVASTSFRPHWTELTWSDVFKLPARTGFRVIDTDMAAILYTSGSTGLPKGVVLSHRNLVAGAMSVASYLENNSQDILLAVLPLSFDAGFSQLTTGFLKGARVVLLNYLLPQDVIKTIERERVTGLTAVPPLYFQLAKLKWPATINSHLRYFANTGGHMPRPVLDEMRRHVPTASPFLMYGLTEAFRSTYLPPDEIDRRPDSIGKAIPNAEVLVLREDGTPCAVDEPGELVHRGALVSMGYWGDREKTAERFKVLPNSNRSQTSGLQLPEYAVFSGDIVRFDQDGYHYFIGRNDETIKTSGYRVSPTEVEEFLYSTGRVGECIAFGVPHAQLGHAIEVIATLVDEASTIDSFALIAECREKLPNYMVPNGITIHKAPLPRNANGKIDRRRLIADRGAARPSTSITLEDSDDEPA